jgi:hypothetical protein
VTVIDVEDLLSAERDENEVRKDFTPSEAVAIGRLIEDQERPKAVERKREGSRLGGLKAQGSDNLPEPSTGPRGQVRDVVARAVGLSPSTYARARAVVAAAEADPARYPLGSQAV